MSKMPNGVERAGLDELARLEMIARRVASLHAASWKSAYRGIFADAYLDGDIEAERLSHWRGRVAALAQASGEKVGEIFLASIARQPAGFLCIEIGPEQEWGALVDNVHVLPRYKGTNIGGRLLARGEEWALRHGERQLYLWVFEDNHAARRFYQREGWREGERQFHEIPGGGSKAVWRLIKRP